MHASAFCIWPRATLYLFHRGNNTYALLLQCVASQLSAAGLHVPDSTAESESIQRTSSAESTRSSSHAFCSVSGFSFLPADTDFASWSYNRNPDISTTYMSLTHKGHNNSQQTSGRAGTCQHAKEALHPILTQHGVRVFFPTQACGNRTCSHKRSSSRR